MTTEALDGTRWNWVLYGIPAAATALAEGTTGVGTPGVSSDGPELKYYGPCSKGPGAKQYTFTLYALSAPPTLPSAADGPAVTAAITAITLDRAQITVSYTRPQTP